MAQNVAAQIRSYDPDPVPFDLPSITGTMGSWGIRGMNLGSTCCINTSVSMVGDQALANSVTTTPRQTPNTQVLRHFALDQHPYVSVGNAAWFLEHPDKEKFGIPELDGPVTGMVYGSLECHSVVAKHRSRGEFISGVATQDDCRTEFCGRLVADMCYRMLSSLNVARGNMAAEFAAAAPAIVDVPSSCRTDGCHNVDVLPGGFTPQTDCFKCHQG